MTIAEIKELLELFQTSGVGEMEVQRGENRVRLSRSAPGATVMTSAPAAVVSAGQASVAPAAPADVSTPVAAAAEQGLETVTSPIVGTYYEKPAPDAPPFVKAGDEVETGHVLCIIESMKLMNEIKAEAAGTVLAKLVADGNPVEYGQPLFSIRPR